MSSAHSWAGFDRSTASVVKSTHPTHGGGSKFDGAVIPRGKLLFIWASSILQSKSVPTDTKNCPKITPFFFSRGTLRYIWAYPSSGGKSASQVFYITILYTAVYELNLKQDPSINSISTRQAIISNWKEEARSLCVHT